MKQFWMGIIGAAAIGALVLIGVREVRNRHLPTAADKPTVKIGISLPLTGAVSYVGQPAKQAAFLALSKHKNTKFNYKLIFEDDQLSLKKASMAGNKLFNMDKVNAAVSIWAVTSSVFKDLAVKNDIIHMTCSWGRGYSDGVNNFNNTTSDIRQAKKLVEIFKRKGVKKIGYVYQASKGDLEVKETVFNELAKAGIDVVYAEEFNFGNRDYRMFLSKIADKPVDMMAVILIPEDMYNFVKQKTEMGNTTPMTTIDYFSTFADKSAVEGLPFVSSSQGTEKFAGEFAKISKAQLGQCIANTYDNVDLIIHAFETAAAEEGKLPSREAVVEVLRSIKNRDGALGKLSVLPNGHIDSVAYIAVIKNGKLFLEE